jgi:hypothetical protein
MTLQGRDGTGSSGPGFSPERQHMAQTVQYTSLGGRLMDSIKGVVAGLVFFVGSFIVLFWNEGRAVRTAKGLEEGQKACVEATADRLDPATDGKLVHLSGPAITSSVLKDPQFGVTLNALKLERSVSMYQWVESQHTKTEKQLGGGERKVTTYTYNREWSETWHDSNGFHEKQTPPNPPMKVKSQSWVAEPVTLGLFTLPRHMVDALPADEQLPVEGTGSTPAGSYTAHDSGFYIGADPGNPQIGDLRISYSVRKPGDVSLLARRNGSTFEPYITEQNTTISVITPGVLSAGLMFQQEIAANTMLTWILRGAGWLAMAMGLGLIFKPIATLGDVVPLIGGVLRAGIGVFALLLSLTFSLVTVGFAWLAYRPVLGISLLGGALAVFIVAMMRRKAKPPAMRTP